MTPRIYVVCRQSQVYTPERVRWLRFQIPQYEMVVLGDYPGASMPLLYGWPGWWSKMELMRPEIPGDVFYMDLDTVPLSHVGNFMKVGRTTFLSDFYRPQQLQSSVFYMTAEDRATVWAEWIKDPAGHISRYSVKRAGFNGDQNFIEEVLGRGVWRWQDTPADTPVCSWKVDVVGRGHKPTRGLIVFHGRPRPWEVAGAPWN